MSMAGKFVVKTARNGDIYFRLQAGNGETMLKSETYASKASALNGIESVRKSCGRSLRRHQPRPASAGSLARSSAGEPLCGTRDLRRALVRAWPICRPRLRTHGGLAPGKSVKQKQPISLQGARSAARAVTTVSSTRPSPQFEPKLPTTSAVQLVLLNQA